MPPTRSKRPKTARPRRPASRTVLGLMSGTSADGVDGACVAIRGTGLSMKAELLRHHHRPYPHRLRKRLLAIMAPAAARTEELASLHAELGDFFARFAREVIDQAPNASRPRLIGLAGQTVCHLPRRGSRRTVTLQLGEPARVAARTGRPVVADFRQGDVAAGGQGAPLVPWTDWVLFHDRSISRAVQNIGGIGNVTWLPAGGDIEDVIAFDTGPGNMIIDELVAEATRGRQRMDRDGRRAARGQVLTAVLDEWMKLPFFRRRPPKSTGRELFGRAFVEAQRDRLRSASTSADDWIATATALTARSIALACRRHLPGFAMALPARRSSDARRQSGNAPESSSARGASRSRRRSSTHIEPAGRASPTTPVELIVCGGGALNPTLISMIAGELPGVRVRIIDAMGIPTQAKEALSFALLAAARVDRVHANCPRATGAQHPTLLGQLIEP